VGEGAKRTTTDIKKILTLQRLNCKTKCQQVPDIALGFLYFYIFVMSEPQRGVTIQENKEISNTFFVVFFFALLCAMKTLWGNLTDSRHPIPGSWITSLCTNFFELRIRISKKNEYRINGRKKMAFTANFNFQENLNRNGLSSK
jgi:hypothetical protein